MQRLPDSYCAPAGRGWDTQGHRLGNSGGRLAVYSVAPVPPDGLYAAMCTACPPVAGLGHVLEPVTVEGHHSGFGAGEERGQHDQAGQESEQRR